MRVGCKMATAKHTLLSLILTAGLTALTATGQKAEQPEVVTKYGTVRGYQIRVNAAERSVNVFLGLPFAKPPVGPLRFSEPQPPEPWRGVRDATSYPPISYLHWQRACSIMPFQRVVQSRFYSLKSLRRMHRLSTKLNLPMEVNGKLVHENVTIFFLLQRIAAAAGCEKSSSAALVECLRGKTEEEIEQITLKLPPLFISACVDGVFLPMTPRQLLSQKEINAVPYIVGVNNCEFGWGLPTMLKFPDFTEGLDKEVAYQLLQNFLASPPESFNSDAIDRVFNEYIGKAESRAQVRDGLLDALGDYMFVFSAVEVARYHRDAGHPVYFYEFQHRPSSATGVVPEFVKADHGSEIAFVFGKPFLAGNATEEENKLSRTVMKYWTNFARNGNPNGEGLVHWPQYDLDERYLEIDLIQKAAKKLKEQKMEFWVQLTEQMRNERRREHTDL
ncbi:UNVERIFIED_CONTAM: hypothetical protein H355_015545 [Colinus virginianus]|nr:hypothetical protein H355_015545 [Colinus virginianus]